MMIKLNALYELPERSILIRLGVVLGLLGVLGLATMISTIIIAETTKGEAVAVNLAGSVRMQSFRIASLLLDRSDSDIGNHTTEIVVAMNRLEATLLAPRVTAVVPLNPVDTRRLAYERILSNWDKAMRPLFNEHLKLLNEAAASPQMTNTLPTQRSPQFLPSVAVFVDRVDRFVKTLEQDIESKNLLLRLIQGSALALTLVALVIAVYIVQKSVFKPLRSLVRAAESIRDRNLTARVTHTASDELGRVGQAFNLMAAELSRLYTDLEQRVDEKTASLERSNRSLDLLYNSIGRIYQSPVEPDTYTLLLKDFEEILNIGHGTVCLAQQEVLPRGASGVVMRRLHGGDDLCSASDCDEAFCGGARRWREIKSAGHIQVLSLPLGDVEGYYGVLQWGIPRGAALEPWQLHLLEALSLHMGNAIGAARRIDQKRRWALHEERTIIARELHDSLAQALSYMKIQVSRLQTVIERHDEAKESQMILSELGDGLNDAYRKLRELLSTFRLKVEHGLDEALEKTVTEFSSRGSIPIRLTAELDNCELTPNEEIHLVQIVRESLANVIHHARASRAEVSIRCNPDGGITAVIVDDGIGFNIQSASAKTDHYGHMIMQERARNLNGILSVQLREEGGTRVTLRFTPTIQTIPTLRLVGGSV
jgi:two-component system nitrate/nitrite sensor histidine kinase NarX